MKKSFLNFVLTLVLAFILSSFLPWWSGMLAALIISAIVRLRKAAVFIVPFTAIAFLWIIKAYLISSANEFILAERVTILLQIEGNLFLLFMLTGLIGGISAGIAGSLGYRLNKLFINQSE